MNWHDQVGKLVTKDGHNAWRVVGYCDEPTVIIEHCDTKEIIRTGISGLLAQDWMRLVPEDEATKGNDECDENRIVVGDRVTVYNRYLFGVPVRATVIGVGRCDDSLQLSFDEGPHGQHNVTDRNGGYFFREECRKIAKEGV